MQTTIFVWIFYTLACQPYPTHTRVTPSANPLIAENCSALQLLHSVDALQIFVFLVVSSYVNHLAQEYKLSPFGGNE